MDDARSARARPLPHQGKASVTARRAGVSRALHQLVDDEPKVLADPVAVRLVEAVAPGALAAETETCRLPENTWRRSLMVYRSRFAEDELAEAARQGVRQYVVLGAGLDTFAYRQPPYADGLRVFEVDHPATQAWKREALAAAGLLTPTNLTWAPVDFERDTLAAGLAAAGFDSARPACFTWLAVTQFLTRPAIDETLRFVARLPAPSTIVLSFILSDDQALPDDERERKRQTVRRAAELGEPWVTFFHPDELCAHLRDLGFGRVFHITPAEANARYFAGRKDGMRAGNLEQLVSATV